MATLYGRKFLQHPFRFAAYAACAALVGACAGPQRIQDASLAERKAVELANAKCMHDFGREPFHTGYFTAVWSGDKWLWGWLDPAGGQGYTAQVSFKADGTDPEVALSFGEPSQVDIEEPNSPKLDEQTWPDPLSATNPDDR